MTLKAGNGGEKSGRSAQSSDPSLLQTYLNTGVYSLAGRLTSIGCGVGFIWLLTSILGKTEFGLFILAYTVVSILGALVATSFERIVLYRIPEEAESEYAEALADHVLFWTLTLGTAVSLGLFATSKFWADVLGQPGFAMWSAALCGLIPLSAARTIGVAYCRAREQIGWAVAYGDIIHNVARVALLTVLWLAGGSAGLLVVALYVADLAPLSLMMPIERLWPRPRTGLLSRADLRYGLQMLGTQAVNQSSRRFDTVLLGGLAASTAVADYAVASRISAGLLLGKQAVLPLLAPRLRLSIARGEKEQAQREYAGTRVFGGIVAFLGALVIIVAGTEVLSLFGDYESAFSVLLFLTATVLVRIATGACGEYVAAAGHSRIVLVSSFASLVVMVAGAFTFVPEYGAMGMGLALCVGTIVNQVLLLGAAFRLEDVVLVDALGALIIAVSAVALVAMGLEFLGTVGAGAMLACALGFYVFADRRTFSVLRRAVAQGLF